MEVVTLVFDEILHVHRSLRISTDPPETIFSFKSNHEYEPYVTVPGEPRLEPGMRVRALLRNASDWKSLVGWVDLETGAIAAPNPAWHLYSIAISVAAMVLLFVMARPESYKLDSWLQAPLVLFLLAWLAFVVVSLRGWRQARADAREVSKLLLENEA